MAIFLEKEKVSWPKKSGKGFGQKKKNKRKIEKQLFTAPSFWKEGFTRSFSFPVQFLKMGVSNGKQNQSVYY